MTQRMIKFPSISQFRNVVHTVVSRAQYVGKDENVEPVFDEAKPLPVLPFQGTTKLHGCVHADTLITLADGSRERIKDVVPGTSVLSYDEHTQQIVVDVVDSVIVQELDKPWIELSFNNGTTLKCTVDHPLLTTEGWVAAEDITEDHQLIID